MMFARPRLEGDLAPFNLSLLEFAILDALSGNCLTIEALTEQIPDAPWQRLEDRGYILLHGGLRRLTLTKHGEDVLHILRNYLNSKSTAGL